MSKNTHKDIYTDLFGLNARGFVTDKTITPDGFRKTRTDEIRAAIRRWYKPVSSFTDVYSFQIAKDLSELLGTVYPNAGGTIRGDVENGEVILAMYLEGYRVRREGSCARFNVSLDQVKALQLYNHPERSEGNVSKIYWKVLSVDGRFDERYDLGKGGVLVKVGKPEDRCIPALKP